MYLLAIKGRHLIIRAIHKIFCILFIHDVPRYRCGIADMDMASNVIYDLLMSERPCMIARYGSNELRCMTIVNNMLSNNRNVIEYICDRTPQWWWDEVNIRNMKTNAGFFSNSKDNLIRFSLLMKECSKNIDILGIWQTSEKYLNDILPNNITQIPLIYLEPYWAKVPWTKALEGKKVLVIHPFAKQIERQYSINRKNIFENQYVLPCFELKTIEAVQSIGGNDNGFKDWFEALEWTKREIEKQDYEICLIGCGAYGFPLASYVKESGKKAVHLGGALQLLFGIKGKRWDNPNYGIQEFGVTNSYKTLFNEYWEYPDDDNKPILYKEVEDGCYWR